MSEYHHGGCDVKRENLSTTREAVMSLGSAKYQQGGCDVYRKSLSTNRVAVMSTGRVL